jgi:sugar phosphate isomerase/epimerase
VVIENAIEVNVRISVFPKGELDAITVHRTMSVFDWIEQAATLPIDGLELYSGMFTDAGEAYVDSIGEAIAATGLAVPMLCASPDFTHPDPAVRAAEIDRHAQLIRIAHRLGGPGASARVLSGQAHPEVGREQGVAWAVEAITELLPLARELDVTLAMENHYKDGFWRYPEFAQRPEIYHQIVDRIEDRVHFGVQYDPSNAIVAGVDSADFLDTVIDRVVTVQASDRSLAPGGSLAELRRADGTLGYSPMLRHGVIGDGLNDYPRIFRTLVAAGYDGWISIEDGVNGFDEMRRSVEFLRQARDRYFGGSTAVRVRTHDEARAAAGLPSRSLPARTSARRYHVEDEG